MSSSLMGFCDPINCAHECDCDCHRPGLSRVKHAAHIFACCNPCSLCRRKIRIGSESEHNETCHKPILKKMPGPAIPKKYESR